MAQAFGRPERILTTTDLSDASEVAVSYAAVLAEIAGAELVLVMNVNAPERAVLEERASEDVIDVEEAALSALREMVGRLAPGVDSSVRTTFTDFSADGVLGLAKREEIDLIVISTRGRGGMRRLVLGSVADKVARSAKIPVVIVPAYSETDD